MPGKFRAANFLFPAVIKTHAFFFFFFFPSVLKTPTNTHNSTLQAQVHHHNPPQRKYAEHTTNSARHQTALLRFQFSHFHFFSFLRTSSYTPSFSTMTTHFNEQTPCINTIHLPLLLCIQNYFTCYVSSCHRPRMNHLKT